LIGEEEYPLVQRPPLTAAKVLYKLFRGLVRLATGPARLLPEGPAKNAVRRLVLSFQHSLPTEFAVNKGDTVVQVGTPHPRTLLRFARAVGPNGRLVVVEAMPENQDRLVQAVASHGLRNVTIVRAAACNENRMGELALSPLGGDHKIPLAGISIDNDARPENVEMRLVPCQFVRLDDALTPLGVATIDYLSVTVNGAEAEVIKGTEKILRASPSGSRLYAKGHAIDALGAPLHRQIEMLARSLGYATKVTRGEPSSTQARRAGDIFAWKP
jgi:FkbM family methyltransferase